MTFERYHLTELAELLAEARAVVSMRQVYEGATADDVIGLRHDVDDNRGSLKTAVRMAEWEEKHGYRSTYYLLHTASYWGAPGFPGAVEFIAGCGHEIGIHTNAITEALQTGRNHHDILAEAIGYLRRLGHEIVGVAAHGDPLCYEAHYINDEMFLECARPEMGEPDRTISYGSRELPLEPRPLAAFGLLYDTHRLPHGRYLSDSGGRWNEPFPGIGTGQLHVLQHPDWWGRVFTDKQPVAA